MKNKIITSYELMGLVKNGQAPKRIKCFDTIYIIDNLEYYYRAEDDRSNSLFEKIFGILNDSDALDETIEILDEENDEFEDIVILIDNDEFHFMNRQNGMTQEDRRLLDSNFKTLGDTINQLIRNQKKIIERLNKDE